jgi:hypothetical protein
MFTIPCEAIFNNHPRVFRSALVGVGPKGRQRPVICIELEPDDSGKVFHNAFPVDIRHNSKIFREKLTVWAEKKMLSTKF